MNDVETPEEQYFVLVYECEGVNQGECYIEYRDGGRHAMMLSTIWGSLMTQAKACDVAKRISRSCENGGKKIALVVRFDCGYSTRLETTKFHVNDMCDFI